MRFTQSDFVPEQVEWLALFHCLSYLDEHLGNDAIASRAHVQGDLVSLNNGYNLVLVNMLTHFLENLLYCAENALS